MIFDESELKVETYYPDGERRGMTAGIPRIGVRVTHLPTGLVATCDEHRSTFRCRREAVERLADMVTDPDRAALRLATMPEAGR